MISKVFCSRKGADVEGKLNDFFSTEPISIISINFNFIKAYERPNYIATVQYEPRKEELNYQAKVLFWNASVSGHPEEILQRKIDRICENGDLAFLETTGYSKGWAILVITSANS